MRAGAPGNEAGWIARAQEAGVLPEEDAATLRDLHGLRNVLVHRYGRLDDALVFQHLGRAPERLLRLQRGFRAALDRLK